MEEKEKIAERLAALKVGTEDLERQEKMIDRETGRVNRSVGEILKRRAGDKFDRELAERLIKKINVYPKHKVEIVFNYRRNELFCGREEYE